MEQKKRARARLVSTWSNIILYTLVSRLTNKP